jgi:hypothetical protein
MLNTDARAGAAAFRRKAYPRDGKKPRGFRDGDPH